MPHKRAKGPARGREKAERAANLAPKTSIEHEPIPKSVSRVLNAGQIRREYRKKKRELEGADNSDQEGVGRKKRRFDGSGVKDGGERTELTIKAGETVTAFNRRVESGMMPFIKTALRRSSARARKVRREGVAREMLQRGKHGDNKTRRSLPETMQKGSFSPPAAAADERTVRDAVKDFQVLSTSTPRRLNDIAQEPPTIKKIPHRVTMNNTVQSGVLSMAQRVMMEVERDRVIRHYREMKDKRLREAGSVKDGC